jgi:hypothetical protein
MGCSRRPSLPRLITATINAVTAAGVPRDQIGEVRATHDGDVTVTMKGGGTVTIDRARVATENEWDEVFKDDGNDRA